MIQEELKNGGCSIPNRGTVFNFSSTPKRYQKSLIISEFKSQEEILKYQENKTK